MYFGIAVVIALIMLGLLLLTMYNNRSKSRHDKYLALNGLKPVYLAMTFFGLGVPAVASVPLLLAMQRYRNSARKCPRCGTKMNKVDEVHDNDYLNQAQDTEERIGSVDYDVWLCPKCGETDIEPYVKANSGYRVCELCHSRACRLTRDRILYPATTARKGQGVKEYTCLNCGHVNSVYYVIPTLVAPIIISGGGRGGHGGGGFGGFDFSGADFSDIFGDIFGDLFGGGRRSGGRGNGPMKGANIRTSVRITFEEAVFGVEKEIELTLKDECTSCHGTGAKPGTSPETCSKCGGKGQVVFTSQSFFGTVRNVQTCPDCHGTGKVIRISVPTAVVRVILQTKRRYRFPYPPVSTTDRPSLSGVRAMPARTAGLPETCSLPSACGPIPCSGGRAGHPPGAGGSAVWPGPGPDGLQGPGG